MASSFFPETTGGRGSWFYETVRFIWVRLYKLAGWRTIGAVPEGKKFMVIAAPHTSNWDFPIGFACALDLRLSLTYIGKDALFKGPFGWVMKYLGGYPLDRSSKQDLVAQISTAYQNADELMIVIAPEGTRSYAERWKTGFYHIADKAQVPILMGVLDWGKKECGIAGSLSTTGDYEADMKKIAAVYDQTEGKIPENKSAYL